jgi:peptidoglycan/xylan/chitin deacetylase (PgdA/CDA1 family)
MICRQLKHTIVSVANSCGVDRLFRHINRKKLLVVMYHGVTSNDYAPPIWTQLPLKTFRQQIEYLCGHYVPVSLTEVTGATRGVSTLPDHAVLITFDDGLRNNYSVAFPVLRELSVPAAIFLTIDYIG